MIIKYIKTLFLSSFVAALLDLFLFIRFDFLIQPLPSDNDVNMIGFFIWAAFVIGFIVFMVIAIPLTLFLNYKKIRINFITAIFLGSSIPFLIDLYSMYDMNFSQMGLWITYPAIIHSIIYYYFAKKYKLINHFNNETNSNQ